MVLNVGERSRATVCERRWRPVVRLAAIPALLSSSLDGNRERRREICDDYGVTLLGSLLINAQQAAVLRPKVEKNRTPFEEFESVVFEKCSLRLSTIGGTTMSLSSDVIDRLPHVEGLLNYLAPMAAKPMNLTYDPPPGMPRSTGIPEPHVMPIHDARPVAGRLTLDGEGLALVEHRSAVKDFYDEDEVRRVYYPEAERLVAEATGASRVLVFDHTIRRRVAGGIDRSPGTPRQPVTSVHNDYTVKSGPQRVRDLMGEEAEELLRHRFEIVNVWRPIRGPLRDAPLAVCDATSVALADFVPSDLVYRDRIGETYRVRYNPAHRWFYVPEMRADEAVLIKCYDSVEDGTARFTAHSAFEDPTAPPDVLPRESIEVRTLVFHHT